MLNVFFCDSTKSPPPPSEKSHMNPCQVHLITPNYVIYAVSSSVMAGTFYWEGGGGQVSKEFREGEILCREIP